MISALQVDSGIFALVHEFSNRFSYVVFACNSCLFDSVNTAKILSLCVVSASYLQILHFATNEIDIQPAIPTILL